MKKMLCLLLTALLLCVQLTASADGCYVLLREMLAEVVGEPIVLLAAEDEEVPFPGSVVLAMEFWNEDPAGLMLLGDNEAGLPEISLWSAAEPVKIALSILTYLSFDGFAARLDEGHDLFYLTQFGEQDSLWRVDNAADAAEAAAVLMQYFTGLDE